MVFFTIFLSIAMAQPPEEREATKKTLQALASYPQSKRTGEYAKKEFIKMTDISPSVMSALGIIGAGAIQGKISTSKIKKMDAKILDVKVRPDLEYNFEDKDARAKVLIFKEF